MNKIKVGIIGATGYVGAELIRLLMNHDKVEVTAIGSNSYVGKDIVDIYPSIGYKNNMICIENEKVIDMCDVVFTALPHGVSEKFVIKAIKSKKKVIDLGADFRIKDEEVYSKWYGVSFIDKILHKKAVYGLSEIYKEDIKDADIIANPGCYPTSISLPLMPLLSSKLIKNNNIIIDSKSGLTGAGRELSISSHFTEVNENITAYKIGKHRHTPEIEQNLSESCKEKVSVVFTPNLIPVNRGILSTIYCTKEDNISINDIHRKLTDYYEFKEFIEILPLDKVASLKNVRFSNKCVISLHENGDTLIICSAIDNMIKGAAGQAIQNMNIIFGIEENTGLENIAPSF
ncbi:N-acetyl-gamma-glutamyl-phosphate reductase [Clostridioides difficile]|nr:N-acetyl-gamma-glutamyl-phosphate reductase [Clostridioides difficile]EIS9595987.1 N-acetyl-gamma-glutamyl-phosphate reductase [Clostridioides difficile]EIS9608502.1 N-acetyl-gamma-glutamyl-phosphate reductase [Clostridioides difficile]EIS9878037.1 N-acetyl-gamma-glutamyl-phosphate reductase [Clostridioides difficile]